MTFVEELQEKQREKVLAFAKEFVETMKPTLVKSAESGYKAYRYVLDTENPTEKEKLQLYTDTLFVELLNENLDGVKVTHETEFIENLFFKGRGWYKHSLVFKW